MFTNSKIIRTTSDRICHIIITLLICATVYLCVREICFSSVAINGLLVGKALTVKTHK